MFKLLKIENSHVSAPEIIKLPKIAGHIIPAGSLLASERGFVVTADHARKMELIAVATAAPIAPKLGMRAKLRTILVSAPTLAVTKDRILLFSKKYTLPINAEKAENIIAMARTGTYFQDE